MKTAARLVLAAFAASLLAACATPPAAQVDETRTMRPLDAKADLERGARRR